MTNTNLCDDNFSCSVQLLEAPALETMPTFADQLECADVVTLVHALVLQRFVSIL